MPAFLALRRSSGTFQLAKDVAAPPRWPAFWREVLAGLPEVAYFVHQLMEEDSARAAHCQGLLRKLGSTGTGPPDISACRA
jgi:hypothetical protein